MASGINRQSLAHECLCMLQHHVDDANCGEEGFRSGAFLTTSAIARRTGLDRKAVQEHLRRESPSNAVSRHSPEDQRGQNVVTGAQRSERVRTVVRYP